MLPETRNRTRSVRTPGLPRASDLFGVFDDYFTRPLGTWSAWTPAADLYETGDEFVLEMNLPGLTHDDIELTVERGVLTVTGQRARNEETDEATYHLRERSIERFSRSFSLPRSIDAEHVKAKFSNGVLKVELPKAEEAKPRRIEVSS